MDGKEPPADQPYTPLGYSAGRWDGDALVITTTHIDWPYFELYGLVGVPQSRAMRIVERFTPRDGGATLQYDWTATDPANVHETSQLRELRDVPLAAVARLPAVRLHRGRAQGAQRALTLGRGAASPHPCGRFDD